MSDHASDNMNDSSSGSRSDNRSDHVSDNMNDSSSYSRSDNRCDNRSGKSGSGIGNIGSKGRGRRLYPQLPSCLPACRSSCLSAYLLVCLSACLLVCVETYIYIDLPGGDRQVIPQVLQMLVLGISIGTRTHFPAICI